METITLNKSIGRTRRETLGGRAYIVAPLSMLVPGVLNGSRGPLLYPPELVNRNPAVWNHMPIVVYHPMEMGKPTSARDPYILNKQGIGFVFRSRENGRAEGWFDVENTKRVDPRVYEALIKGQPMELSTGLFTKNAKAAPDSNFRGKKYVEVVKDFTPDHLAILPDQKGACSMNDGCGMLINQSNQTALDKALQIVENFNPSQPRDARGRWSGGGGGGASGGKGKSSEGMGLGGVGRQPTGGELTKHKETADKYTKLATKLSASASTPEGHLAAAQKHTVAGIYHEKIGATGKATEHYGKASEHQAAAKSGAATDSHETVKQMQKPGNTTKLARKLTSDDVAQEAAKALRDRDTKGIPLPSPKEIIQRAKDSVGYKKSKKKPTQNQEGSQFGKPHNTVKEMPNMAKQRQVQNEEVELTEDDREELIDMIVDNCACEEASDRETLNQLSDKTLSQIAVNAIPPQFMKDKKKVVAEEEESDEEMEDEEEVPVKNQAGKKPMKILPEKKVVTVNRTQSAMSAEDKMLLNYAREKMQEEKDSLIEKLTANVDKDDIEETAEVLNEKSLDELKVMSRLLPKEEKQPVQNSRGGRMRSSIREEQSESRGRNFTGAGGALPKSQARQVNNSNRSKANDDDDALSGPLESPTINYAEIAGYQNGNFIHRNNLGSMVSSN